MATCPFFEEKHKVQCKAPAFGPLSPSGCQGRPFSEQCTVNPLCWRLMCSKEQLKQFADELRRDVAEVSQFRLGGFQ